jgi:hypothetical protein
MKVIYSQSQQRGNHDYISSLEATKSYPLVCKLSYHFAIFYHLDILDIEGITHFDHNMV